ncbi:hypothetical protein SISSUDRAFT_1045284 [Sistotremastrum suecicum HHB10207 ss-3]|uniref:MARVEL domain-containing protein n=1 Tax=Sistotremastrum suecicum HHB10207 ss-3 TaxID=1314776 RepID=A0A166EHY5_9AGAM|nr:hypothetical protein SISSUDRAFT_1045284 [Sistotremastrum suecicum HHB10207 ss-3]
MSPSHDHHRRAPSGQRRHHSSQKPTPRRPLTAFAVFRICLYVVVMLWSLITLAIAAHFLSILQLDDLTRFIPYSLFTASASTLGMIILPICLFFLRSDPVSAKTEIFTTGLVGFFWLGLAALTSTSASQDADVECFADDDDTAPVEGGFATDTFHAQYRVIKAASILNATFLLGFCIVLTFFAIRHHQRTKEWVSSVSAKPAFAQRKKYQTAFTAVPPRPTTTRPAKELPLPATEKNQPKAPARAASRPKPTTTTTPGVSSAPRRERSAREPPTRETPRTPPVAINRSMPPRRSAR